VQRLESSASSTPKPLLPTAPRSP